MLCRLMIDMMRGVHTAYAPANEPFGTRPEAFFIGVCVALGHMDGKPFSVAKIAAYARATEHCHTQAKSIAKLGLNLPPGTSILPAR
jgi:hypothetical protein